MSVSPGTSGQVLVSNGASADPTFQNLPTIAVASGGTGATTLTNHGVVIGQGTSAVHVTTAGTAGQVLTSGGASADPTFQAIPIPNIDVAHGGTGVATLTNHGVVIGQGTSAVHITGTGTAGQVLTSNGASADPTFQSGTATYPPLPVPDLQTFLQAHADAGTFADWIWGDVLNLSAPVVVTVLDNRNNIGVDFHGAFLQRNFIDTATDVLTYSMPATATVAAQIQGLQIRNLTIYGVNSSSALAANNCLTISCPSHNNGVFGVHVDNVSTIGCARSGIQFYGAVFEADLYAPYCRGCVFSGMEFRNPPQGTGGVISSINIWGGDSRVNGSFSNTGGQGYGIAMTADVAFQEASGIHIQMTNFIGNCSAGLYAPAGVATIFGSHFENNCSSNAGETNGAIWTPGGGGANIAICDAAHSSGNGQTYLLVAVGGGTNTFFNIAQSFSFNEDTDTAELVANNSGTGTMLVDAEYTSADFAGPGWTLRINTTTSTTL